MFSIVVIFILPAADLALFGQKARPLPSHREPFISPAKMALCGAPKLALVSAGNNNLMPANCSPRRTIRGMASSVWLIEDELEYDWITINARKLQPCASYSVLCKCLRPISYILRLFSTDTWSVFFLYRNRFYNDLKI